MRSRLVLLAFIAVNCISMVRCTILDKLRDDPDLSQFYTLLERNPIANATLQLRSVTVFVPTNRAFQKFQGNTSVLYHITTVALTKDQLPKMIPSDLDGNPPLYITRKANGDIFVNNARLVQSRSEQMQNNEGYRQVMHVIEDVLEPVTVLPTSKTEITNPNGFEFLTHADSMNIGPYRLRTYRSQVSRMRRDNLYQSPGTHTFLIPIDEGFKSSTRSSLVDQKVIDGHVILNNVIFTAAARADVPYTTAAFEDNIKVTVSFYVQPDGKIGVKSNTISGDSSHAPGVVIADIVRANIPVKNGVVHLINRPLMIVDTTVDQFIKDNENSALHKFYDTIMDIGGEVLEDIKQLGDITILAPSNEAWNNSNVNNVIRNRKKMREILNMHIIKDRMNVDKIKQNNQEPISQVPTVNNRTFLYFNINSDGSGNETITVEGGGVNATLLQADIAQTNGYVHIIDRVLGVPHATVLGKLSTDPMLNSTYQMSKQSGFLDIINNTMRRYTFFVPSDKAWKKTGLEFPSAHKKLFMRDYAYHAKSILQRHLVIADRTYSMGELAAMSSDAIVLPTIRDSLKLRVVEDSGRYTIYWNFKKINVFRPDVECLNGVIHVIDVPFLEEKDIIVNGGILQAQFPLSALFSSLLTISVAQLLL